MNLLTLLITCLIAVVTLTVETKSSVSTEGILPDKAYAEYSCTYKKGQLTAGNTATLLLYGWHEIEIQRVSIWMRSNKSSGAGQLHMLAGDQDVWSIADASFAEGGWQLAREDSGFTTEYTPVTQRFSPGLIPADGQISLTIEATQNSLFIEKYEIEYIRLAKKVRTVSFETTVGTTPPSVTEDKVGGGILLPSLDWQHESWQFCGWSNSGNISTTEPPLVWKPGSRYYPQQDCTLYAVFTRKDDTPSTSANELTSGVYALCIAPSMMLVAGAPEGDYLPVEEAKLHRIATTGDSVWTIDNHLTPAMAYELTLTSDSAGYIRHAVSGQYLGFSSGKLDNQPFEWIFRRQGDGFQMRNAMGEKAYTLGIVKRSNEYSDYPAAMMTDRGDFYVLLFPMPDDPLYTCDPMHYMESLTDIHVPHSTRKVMLHGTILLRYDAPHDALLYDLLGNRLY